MKRYASDSRRRGQTLVEFTFVGIPVMFVLISIFEMSRGMWVYHTLANAAKAGVRYSIVHGINCGKNGNSCTKTITDVNQVIRDAGVGLDISKTLVTYSLGSGATKSTVAACTLDLTCSAGSSGTVFPVAQKGDPISIDIVTVFRSAMVFFWPGAKIVSFATANLPAGSSDNVQF